MSTIEEAREQARKLDEPLRQAWDRAEWYQTGSAGLIEAARAALRALLDATEPPAEDVGPAGSCHLCVGAGGHEDHDGEWVECSCERTSAQPAEDEREALASVIDNATMFPNDDIDRAIDAILAAGYRKAPRPVTDEMADAANKAFWAFPEDHDMLSVEWNRARIRVAMRAAEGARR